MQKVKPISTRESVFHGLRQAILNGEYKPGDKLIENKVATFFDVSRTPVREALHRLESEGLIKVYPRKYCEVVGISKSMITEINLIRAQLEPLAGSISTEKFSDEDLKYLGELIHLAEKHFLQNDIDSLMEVHDKFHRIFIKTSGMERLIRILDNLHDYIVAFRHSFLSRKELAQRSLKEHREIYDAAKMKDKDEVYQLLSLHLGGISEYESVVLDDK